MIVENPRRGPGSGKQLEPGTGNSGENTGTASMRRTIGRKAMGGTVSDGSERESGCKGGLTWRLSDEGKR